MLIYVWLWSLMAIGAAKFESQRSHNWHTKRDSDGYLRQAGMQAGTLQSA